MEKKHYKVKSQRYTFGGKGNFISQGLLMSFKDFELNFNHDGFTLISGNNYCKLLKNTETELEFLCDFNHPLRGQIINEIYRYILEYKSKIRNCYIVREEIDGGKSWYCIDINN